MQCARNSSSLFLLVLLIGACSHSAPEHPASAPSDAPASLDSALAMPIPSRTPSETQTRVVIPPSEQPSTIPPPGFPEGPSDLPPQREVEFRAIGQTNDWILEIDQQWIMFVHNFGQEREMARVPEPEQGPGSGGFTFRALTNDGRSLEVIWEGRICSDVTSGQPNQNSVIVRLDGVEFRGCGLRRTTSSEPKNR